ncbi:MAG: hypothetical protein V2A66_08160 [Pseudomonadota bacterium]
MKKTIQVINNLEEEGIIDNYAMGGATALLFYAEPSLTFDVDIFVFLPGDKGAKDLVDLSSLYAFLEAKGYHAEKEHVIIEGVPVQFIPVYNALVEESVKNALVKEYEGVKIKVLKIEHLIAIMVDTNRPKDRERVGKILEEASFDRNTLESILRRHSLLERWEKLIEKKQ